MFISEEETGTVKNFRKSVIEREKMCLRVNNTCNEDKGYLKQNLQQSEFGYKEWSDVGFPSVSCKYH